MIYKQTFDRASSTEMSIGVCVRMDEPLVFFFTLALPVLTLMVSIVLRLDTHLRKEMDTLTMGYYGDDM